MIKIENVILPSADQVKFAIEGMRNPKNSWNLSDSEFGVPFCDDFMKIGEKDLDLMKRLANAGTEHRKYLRQLPIALRITAPMYWWKEFDTYKVGTTRNSTSTMHKITSRDIVLDDFSCEHLDGYGISLLKDMIKHLNDCRMTFLDTNIKNWWWQIIQLLPSSYNQTSNVTMNYEVLANIYHQRRNHKLDEWIEFCRWIDTLPMSEVITGK